VGLKHEQSEKNAERIDLSAEPLVGLKRRLVGRMIPNRSFSRTPRGFEARPRRSRCFESSLSAEPLVGLKLGDLAESWMGRLSFSRTPRGFEATKPPTQS